MPRSHENIRKYDGVVLRRNGPAISSDEARTYDVAVTNTDDRLPGLTGLRPWRPPVVSDGTLTEPAVFKCADAGDLCFIHLIDGKIRLYLWESILVTREC